MVSCTSAITALLVKVVRRGSPILCQGRGAAGVGRKEAVGKLVAQASRLWPAQAGRLCHEGPHRRDACATRGWQFRGFREEGGGECSRCEPGCGWPWCWPCPSA